MSTNARPSGGLPARRGARDTRPSVGLQKARGGRCLGAEWTKEGFLEELEFDRRLSSGKERRGGMGKDNCE